MKKIRFFACLCLCLLLLAPGLKGQQACLSWYDNKGNPFPYKPRFFKHNNEKYFHLPLQPQEQNPSGKCVVFFNFRNGEYHLDTLQTGLTYRLNFTEGFPIPAPGADPKPYAEVMRLEKTSGPPHEPIEDEDTPEYNLQEPITNLDIFPHTLPAGTDLDYRIVKEPFIRGNQLLMIVSYRLPQAVDVCAGSKDIKLLTTVEYPADVMTNSHCRSSGAGDIPAVQAPAGATAEYSSPPGTVYIAQDLPPGGLNRQKIHHAFLYFNLKDSLNPGDHGNFLVRMEAGSKIDLFQGKWRVISFLTCPYETEKTSGITLVSSTDPNYLSGPSCIEPAARRSSQHLRYTLHFQNIGTVPEGKFKMQIQLDPRLRLANPGEPLTAHFPSGAVEITSASPNSPQGQSASYSVENSAEGPVVNISIEIQEPSRHLNGLCYLLDSLDNQGDAGQASRLEALQRAIADSKARLAFEVEPEGIAAGQTLEMQAKVLFVSSNFKVPTDPFFIRVAESCTCAPEKKTCFLKRWCRNLFGRRP